MILRGNGMRNWQILIAVMLVSAVAVFQLSAQDSGKTNSRSSPPDSVLLTGPGGSTDLLDQLLDQQSDSEGTPSQRSPAAAGEDLRPGAAADPVLRVGQQMARVEQFLRRRETSEPTQLLQARIVRDLDALIAAAEQQAGGASGSPSQNRRADMSRGGSSGVTRPAGTANGSSTGSTAQQPREDDVWMNRIWGHLPDQLRREIQTPVHETFLPSYEQVIIEYYKRLSEVDR